MSNNELIYCYGIERSADNKVSRIFFIKVFQDTVTHGWNGYELLPPMTLREAFGIKAENLAVKEIDGEYLIRDDFVSNRIPVVSADENGFVRLRLEAFAGEYHRYNPKKLHPSKTALLRTITVLGETCRVTKKYKTYWMTNRKFQVLDENHTEYGYYVCDYNGAVSYLLFDQMQSIAKRYGITNARLNKNRFNTLDWQPFPQFAPPDNALSVRNCDLVSYIKNDESTDDFEIGKLRCYADALFVLRRQNLKFDENSTAEDIQMELDEFLNSIEAFHQALLWGTVPKNEYNRICGKIETLFDENSSFDYKKAKNDTLCRVKNLYFTQTPAFNTMLEKCGSDTKRMINLYTLTILSKDIQDRYSEIILAEQEITELLKAKCNEYNYNLFGLDYRIKSPDSLYEKLYERINDSNKTLEMILEETRDIMRYTVCFNDDGDYCQNIEQLLKFIMVRYSGQLECFRNYWTPYVSGEYKGINATVRIPDVCWDMREKKLKDKSFKGSRYCVYIPSFCFEIQFHTVQSLEVKEKNHKLYEQCRRSDISEEQRQKCFAEMKSNIGAVAIPNGAQYLNMLSNEYITALNDSIRLMKNELSDISKQDNPYVDIKGLLEITE